MEEENKNLTQENENNESLEPTTYVERDKIKHNDIVDEIESTFIKY